MIALRKLFQVFGRGTLIVSSIRPTARSSPTSGSRRNERVLVRRQPIAGLPSLWSWTSPPYVGMVPVEMLGYVEFPRIRTHTLSPHARVLRLLSGWNCNPRPNRSPVLDQEGDEPELHRHQQRFTDWMSVLEGNGRRELEESVLKGYLVRQRWFGAKSRIM